MLQKTVRKTILQQTAVAQLTAGPILALENQLRLSCELKMELIASRSAYMARDLEAIYAHISAQSVLCAHLQRCGAMSPDAVSLDAAAASRAQRLVAELLAVQQEIRKLNYEQLVVVNGHRRTLNMMANASMEFSATYGRPNMPSPLASEEAQP